MWFLSTILFSRECEKSKIDELPFSPILHLCTECGVDINKKHKK